MNIEFATLNYQYRKYQTEYEEAALRVLRSGWYILGDERKQFEKDYALYYGVKHCIGVGNGLDALRIALSALGIGPGDEVIVQANTFIATALAITGVGATPVFVDADSYFGINVDTIKDAISPKTKGIMAVHLYGQPCNMDAVMDIAEQYGLKIIEDCAQAHGAKYKGKLAGTIGDIGCFSFYPMKPIGAFGDAGGIITDDDRIADKIRMLCNYGCKEKYRHEIIGINSRMDELQAAILRVNLRHLDENASERKKIAEKYMEGIKNPKIDLINVRPDTEHAYHVFPILCKKRDELGDYLEKRGIRTQIHYPIPCHLAECYSDLGYKMGSMPTSEFFSAYEISLPVFIGMKNDQIQYILDMINCF